MTLNRNFTKWFIVIALILTAAFPGSALAATGDIISIEIEGSTSGVELTVGKSTKQLKVWATVEGSSTKRDVTGVVTWASSQEDVIKVLNGVVTPLKSGTSRITATYAGTAVSTIEVKAIDTYKALTLEYLNKGKYKLGTSESKLKVTALVEINNTDGDTKDVTANASWSSSNSDVLTVSKGVITLIAAGTSTITAEYAGLKETFTATVSSPYSEVNVLRDGESTPSENIELVIGDSEVILKAQSTSISDQSTLDVTSKATWSSSNDAVATIDGGKLKAVSAGSTIVTVQYLGVKSQVNVYVRAPYEAMLIKPSTAQVLFIGEELQVGAEMRDRANSTLDVTANATWTSSNPLAVSITSGKVIAKAEGTSVIKASHLGVNNKFNVTVYPTITKVAIEETELTTNKGESISLPKITGTKLDDSEIDLSNELVWTSSNEEIAKIEKNKVVTSEAGTVKLTAKFPESPVTASTASSIRTKEITVELTVTEKVLILIPADEKMSVVIGEEVALPVINAVWENGDEAIVTDDVEWTLTGTSAVIKSVATGKVIKGLVKGSATLKGTYGKKTISIPVTIEKKITKIVVEPTTIELNIKKSKSIKVTGYYTDGTTVNLSSKMDWKSSNDEVADISSTSVKAIGEGTATLSGSYQGISSSVKVNVVPKLTKLTVNESKLNLAPSYVKTVVLTAAYDTGTTASVASSATWTSSKPSVATVTDGKIVAVAKGSATIKAKFGGKTVSVRVTVK